MQREAILVRGQVVDRTAVSGRPRDTVAVVTLGTATADIVAADMAAALNMVVDIAVGMETVVLD